MAASARRAPIASRLLAALAIARARKVSERSRMDRALMLTNALRIITFADLARSVSIGRVAMIVCAQPDIVEIHITGESLQMF